MDSDSDTYQFDADTIKIVIAFGCTVFIALSLVGAPLSIILWVGLAYGLYRSDAVYVKVSTRIVQYLALILGLGAGVLNVVRTVNLYSNSYASEYMDGEIKSAYFGAIVAVLLICIAAVAVEYLWLKPITRRLNQLAALGSGATSGLKGLIFGQRSQKIMQLKFPSSFSAADELAKWNDLRNSGAITEDEFAAAKQRLLR